MMPRIRHALLALGLATALVFALPAGAAWAQAWDNLALISSTLGNNTQRLCIGGGTADIGCPTYAPTVSASGLLSTGNISSTGTITAQRFISNVSNSTFFAGAATAGTNNTGNDAIGIGVNALFGNTANSAIGLGVNAGLNNTGQNVIALGSNAGVGNTANDVVLIGQAAGGNNTGIWTVGIGFGSMGSNTGAYSIGLGPNAGYNNTGDFLLALGFEAGRGNTAANQFIVRQSPINTTPLLQGNFATGQLAVGMATPTTALTISGTLRIANGNEACDSNRTGGIRYNAGTFEFCSGSAWQSISTIAGGGGASATDRISSTNNQAMVVATSAGTVSLTTGGVAGTAYFASTGQLVAPTISTTGIISAAAIYARGASNFESTHPGTITPINMINANGGSNAGVAFGAMNTNVVLGNFSFVQDGAAANSRFELQTRANGTLIKPITVVSSGVAILGNGERASATLHVSGTIRIGNAGEPCDSNRVGGIRYNSGTFEFCSGSSWQSLAAVAGSTASPQDRISSTNNQAMVVATSAGTISLTTGGVAGTAYFASTGQLVAPSISTTGAISGTSLATSGNLNLPAQNVAGVTNNVVMAGGSPFIHTYRDAGSNGNNFFIGISSGNRTMSEDAENNIGLGNDTLKSLTDGSSNIAVGFTALTNNNTGDDNTANGHATLESNTSGSGNTAIGVNALNRNTIATGNTATGAYTFEGITTGSNNTAFGYSTGRGITTGSNNTILGANVTALPTDLSNTVILADGSGNRRIYIDFLGRTGIGKTSPTTLLDVSGTLRIANGGEACDSNRTGGIRYNAGTFEFCSGSAWQSLAAVAGSTSSPQDRISSTNNQSMVVATSAGTVSLTTGGVAGTAYFASTGQLVAPTISTTGAISATSLATSGNLNLAAQNVAGVTNNAILQNGSPFIHTYRATGSTGNNLFMGVSSGNMSLTSASNGNVGVGPSALSALTSGYSNVALGASALSANTTGVNNVAIGFEALMFNQTTLDNVAIGYQALRQNIASNNIAIGPAALSSLNSSGSFSNTVMGYNAMFGTATGSENTVIGNYTLPNFTTGSKNTIVGSASGLGIVLGDNNTILGARVQNLPSDLSNTVIIADGDGNRRIYIDFLGRTGVGKTSATTLLDVSGTLRIANGGEACDSNRTGGIRYNAGTFEFCSGSAWQSISTIAGGGGASATDRISSTNNQAMVVATSAGTISLTTGGVAGTAYFASTGQLVAPTISTTGAISGTSLATSGRLNLAAQNVAGGITTNAILQNGSPFIHTFRPTGNDGQNLFIGVSSGNITMSAASAASASYNVGVGQNTLSANTSGFNNTASGVNTLRDNTTGFNNTANGVNAMRANTVGYNNTALGYFALRYSTDGNQNTAMGMNALQGVVSGANNTALGFGAGSDIVGGYNNTILGANTFGLPSDLSNSVVIADGSGDSRFYSNFLGQTGIGKTNPTTRLDVSGTLRIANGGEACDSNRAGGIRYNAGTFEFCSGSAWQSISTIAGGGGASATDRISSTNNQAMVVATSAGTVSLTTGGVAGTAYFASTGQLVAPTISTTGIGRFASISSTGIITAQSFVSDVSNTNFFAGSARAGLASNAGDLIGIGNDALYGVIGYGSIGLGAGALSGYSNTSAGIGIGSAAGTNSSGQSPIAIGNLAGYNNSGEYIVAIGSGAGRNNTGVRLIALGYGAGEGNTANDQFIVRQAQINLAPLLQGNFATGQLAVGMATPTTALTISGTLRIANGGEACDSNRTGGIRYNAGTFEFCSGSAWQSISTIAGGGGGASATDRISSTNNQAMVVATSAGTVSLTTGGVAGTAYFNTTGQLVVPTISTTGAISASSGYFAGQVNSAAFNAGSGTTFNWNNGNTQYTSANCGAMTFSSMRDGGSYNLVVTGATSASCTFSHTGLTFRYPPGYGATTASTHTIFGFLRAGTVVYVTSVRGLI